MKKIIKKILINLLIVIALAIIIFIAYIIITVKKDNEIVKLKDPFSINDDSSLQIDTTYKELPTGLINAILVSENDTDFFQRETSILKAIFDKNYLNITMIVIKNNLMLTDSSDFIRRIKTAYISRYYIEKEYTKQQILDFYINNIYLSGNGEKNAYGFAAASQIYFEKPINELSISEYTILAANTKLPSINNPYKNFEGATKARNELLDKMTEKKYITEEEADKAKNISISSLVKGTYINVSTDIDAFNNHMKKIDEALKKDDTYGTTAYNGIYKVKYNNITFIATLQDNENVTSNYQTYKYEILYKDKAIEIPELQENEEFEKSKFYLLKDNDKNNAFVLISEVSPTAVHQKYLITVFDELGNILLSKTVKTSKNVEVDSKNNTIYYSYETKLGEPITVENAIDNAKSKEDFCKYLKENYTDDNYIISGNETYEYIEGKINQKEKEEKTVKYYKEKADCK